MGSAHFGRKRADLECLGLGEGRVDQGGVLGEDAGKVAPADLWSVGLLWGAGMLPLAPAVGVHAPLSETPADDSHIRNFRAENLKAQSNTCPDPAVRHRFIQGVFKLYEVG